MYTFFNRTAQDQIDYETRLIQAAHKEGFDQGRAAGFAAGYAAAQGQPQAKIEAAYEQGVAAATKQQKNGVGY